MGDSRVTKRDAAVVCGLGDERRIMDIVSPFRLHQRDQESSCEQPGYVCRRGVEP